ncbi:MAG: CRISPR system precrRNA processing endoribonuclease RAMP protein Cas6, partial [Chloroflexota bacterium]
ATCPACWFVSAENQPGSVVRPYTFVPPRPSRKRIPAGQPFSFGLTLFGEAFRFLPYAVLAAHEMGRIGVGSGRRDGLGRFQLEEIRSHNPFTGERTQLLAPGEQLVRVAPTTIDYTLAATQAESLAARLPNSDNLLRLRFISPMRLEEKKHLYKSPDFAVLFHRLLYRIDDLGRQYAGGERRDREEVFFLNDLAGQVRMVDSRIDWVEQWSWSGRKGARTPLSGFVGTAVYYSTDWGPLLPWLLLGQGTQAGKSAVKGNGVYQLMDQSPGYWDWLADAPVRRTQPDPARMEQQS